MGGDRLEMTAERRRRSLEAVVASKNGSRCLHSLGVGRWLAAVPRRREQRARGRRRRGRLRGRWARMKSWLDSLWETVGHPKRGARMLQTRACCAWQVRQSQYPTDRTHTSTSSCRPSLPLLPSPHSLPSAPMLRRRTVYALLCLLAAVLVGTVVVLSSISYYLHIDYPAYITDEEVNLVLNDAQHTIPERIPRIIHQTWKSETLPATWANVSQGCRDMMPD